MAFQRASGILLHPTSLPGPFGIGDLGGPAFEFCRSIADAGQTYWQILPLGPTGYGDSPYQSFSAFAGNTLLISPKNLLSDGLITDGELAARPAFGVGRVDYGGVYEWKTELLRRAFDSFCSDGRSLRDAFATFSGENTPWLDDYAAYRAIKASQGHRAWFEWPEELRSRYQSELSLEIERLAHEIEAEKFYQFLFFRQWTSLKGHANDLGLKIIGDIPIFVALDSADVWCNQDHFKLNSDGSPEVVAGVPPDYFSKTGQLWGNPIYDWESMERAGFGWWVSRVRHVSKLVDVVRIDHFRGFIGAWEVPGGDKTAENGQWVDGPGIRLFEAVKTELGDVPMIAEDLGVITPEVEKLRDDLGLPGMKILQYAFGGDAKNHDLPHNYITNCIAYTGTHDNETCVGWFSSQQETKSKATQPKLSDAGQHCLKYLNSDGDEIHWDMIRAVWSSVAVAAITQAQDLLGLDNQSRMNLPASSNGNWHWRLTDDLDGETLLKLKELTDLYGRSRADRENGP